MATNFGRVMQGPLTMYFADATQVQYLDLDAVVTTGTLDTDWQVFASGLQINDGITITPTLDPQEVLISEFPQAVAIHHVNTFFTISVAVREITPEVLGRVLNTPTAEHVAVLTIPNRIEVDLQLGHQPQQLSLLLTGPSAYTNNDPGMAWWLPKVVVTEIGDIQYAANAASVLSVTFRTLPDAINGQGKFAMVN